MHHPHHTLAMLDAYPDTLEHPGVLSGAVEALMDVAACASACADVCLASEELSAMRSCIRACLDASVIAAACAQVCTRHTGEDLRVLGSLLAATRTALSACAEECAAHELHAQCRMCAEACEEACRALDELRSALGIPA